ncbi:unnamed protein product [Prorocentrum cordatum]|uniref:Uncharacterized protein n=1 Tax=Prorocentrum cordatum TaxID=2364126 RepID=A0ABN9TLM3_9DINO|nr:unnamed protein product [Polarella glacialis]
MIRPVSPGPAANGLAADLRHDAGRADPETQGNQNKASERPAPATRKPTRRAKRRRRGKGPTARKGAATRGRQAAHGLRRRFSLSILAWTRALQSGPSLKETYSSS